MFKLIGLLVVIAAVAFFTKPNAETMRTAANAQLQQVTSDAAENVDVGGALAGAVAQASEGRYEDLYVVAKYTVPASGDPLVTCWGAFTQSMCQKTGSPQ